MGILCSNCGFVNPDDRTTCIKCRSELPRPTGHITHHDANRAAAPMPPMPQQPAAAESGLEDLATVRREPEERARETAIHVGYEPGGQTGNGHNRQEHGYEERPQQQPSVVTPERTGRSTQDGLAHHRCTLEMVPDEGETLNAQPMKYSGKEVILSRQNTEPNNFSITSKEQAALIYNDGRWYLEDRSQFRSTFLLVAERTELKDGDVILLGDRKFRFKS